MFREDLSKLAVCLGSHIKGFAPTSVLKPSLAFVAD